jgi:hypothetical protein
LQAFRQAIVVGIDADDHYQKIIAKAQLTEMDNHFS